MSIPVESLTPAPGDTGKSVPAARSSRVAFIVLAALLGGVAFIGYYTFARLIVPRIATLEARLDVAGSSESSARAALDTLTAETAAAVSAARAASTDGLQTLNERQQKLEASVEALSGQEVKTDLDWVLAEAEYLILAANQRLALERDIDTALAALNAADSRLRAGAHPGFIALREQLAREIGELEGAGRPDIEGMAIYLAEAVGRVDTLPTKPIADIGLSFANTGEQPLEPENWRGVLAAMWSDLVSLVQIKDSELPDGVLFDPKLRYFLQQNLKLELSSARLAVLSRDSGNLRASLILVQHQLEAYYDQADAGVAALHDWIAAHRTTELDPAVPTIAASLDAVRALRASLRASPGATSGQP